MVSLLVLNCCCAVGLGLRSRPSSCVKFSSSSDGAINRVMITDKYTMIPLLTASDIACGVFLAFSLKLIVCWRLFVVDSEQFISVDTSLVFMPTAFSNKETSCLGANPLSKQPLMLCSVSMYPSSTRVTDIFFTACFK